MRNGGGAILGVAVVLIGYALMKGKIHLPHTLASRGSQTWNTGASDSVFGGFDFSTDPNTAFDFSLDSSGNTVAPGTKLNVNWQWPSN